MEEKLQKLHELLVQRGIDKKSFSEFRDNFSADPDKQRKLHELLVQRGIDKKSFREFQSNFFPQKKSPVGIASSAGSSGQPTVPVAEKSYSWGAVAPGIQQPGSKTNLGIETKPSVGVADKSFIESNEKRIALSSVRDKRKGDYQADAVERLERTMSENEKAKLANRSMLESDSGVTVKQYEAQLSALKDDQTLLSKGLDGIDQEISEALGDTAFEQYEQSIADYKLLKDKYDSYAKNNDPKANDFVKDINRLVEDIEKFQQHPLIQERNQMISAMQKNLDRFKSMQTDEKYKGIRTLEADRAEIQKQVDKQDFMSDASGMVIRAFGNLAAGSGRLVKSAHDMIRGEDVPDTPISNFLIDIGDTANYLFPSPSQYSRGLVTDTAKWGEYDVDFSGDKVRATRKDGKQVDMQLTEEQQKEVEGLEKKKQINWSVAPYQAANVLTDMAVMLAGADKVSKGLNALKIGEKARAKAGVALTTAGQVSNQMYQEGLELFDGDKKKAAEYSFFGALAVGAVQNVLGLESRLLTGRALNTKSLAAAVGKMTPKQIAIESAKMIAKESVGEGFEEGIIENITTAAAQQMIGGKADIDTTQMISDGAMGFAVGSLFAGGNVNMNEIQKSSLYNAAKDPVKFEAALRKAVEKGEIKGDEKFVSEQAVRVQRIGNELSLLSPDLKQEELLDATALIDRKIQVEDRLKAVKGNEELEARYTAELGLINKGLASKVVPPEPEVQEEIQNTIDEEAEIPKTEKEVSVNTEEAEEGTIVSEASITEAKTDKSSIGGKLSKIKNRLPQDDIAEAFNNGKRIMTKSFDGASDANMRKGNSVTMKYLSKDGDPIDSFAKDIADKHGIDEQAAQQMIVDFINDNPNGIGGYVNSRLQQEAEIEGDRISGEVADEIIGELGEADAIILDSFLGRFEKNGELDEAALEEAFNEAEKGFSPEFLDLQKESPIAYQKLKQLIDEKSEKVRSPFGEEEAEIETAETEATAQEQLAPHVSSIASNGGIITDALEAIGLKAPEQALEFLRKFYKKTFTSSGQLPKTVHELDVKRRARINAKMKRASHKGNDLRRQLRKEYPKGVPENILSAIDGLLKNKPTNEPVSIETKAIVNETRAMVDALSSELVTSGLATGKLAATIMGNLDTYLNRSYRIHDDRKAWVDKVKKMPAWGVARNFVSKQISDEMSDLNTRIAAAKSQDRIDSLTKERDSWQNKLNNIDAYLESILNEQADVVGSLGATGSKLGSKNLSIFKKRKDIPKEIRDLMGEYEDPFLNFTRTIFKAAHLLENAKFLSDVKRSGEGVFLFNEPVGEFTHKIAADESNVMSPLSGMYTSAETKEAFETFGKPDVIPNWLLPLVWASSKAKYSKTILSIQSHVRNFFGNWYFHTANGRFGANPNTLKKALDAIRPEFASNKGAREEYAKLVELGVVGDSSTMGEMLAVLEETRNGVDERFAETNLFKKILKPVTETAEKMYQAEDDFHKAVAFYEERQRYLEAFHPGKKLSDLTIGEKLALDEKAASVVRNTLPTYSMVSENVKRLRRIPLLGTFVSFPYEVIRTTSNTVKLARQEMSDPRTRKIGALRLVGMASVNTALAALSKAAFAAAGMDDDDEDKVRDFLPPWSESGLFIPVNKDGADFTYIDVASYVPSGYLLEILNAGFDERKGAAARMGDMLYRFVEPFLGIDMTTKAIKETLENKKETGATIASKDLPITERVADLSANLAKNFEPGTLTTARRIYRSFTDQEQREFAKLNPQYEMLAVFPGIRVSNTNIETSFKFRANDLAERQQVALNVYRKPLRNKMSEKELEEYRQKAYVAYKNVMKETGRIYSNAIELGADPAVLEGYLRAFNSAERTFIRANEVPPIEFLNPAK